MSELKSDSNTLPASNGDRRASSRLSAGSVSVGDGGDTLPIAPGSDQYSGQLTTMGTRALRAGAETPNDEGNIVTAQPVRSLRVSSELPPLPQRKDRRSRGSMLSFILFVLLPVALATYYYTQVASYQYVSEFRFTVKDASPQQGANAGQAASALLGLLGAGGQQSGVSENYIVVDYLTSRQAIEELQKRINIVSLYSHDSIDLWSRFNPILPVERFELYWQRMNSAKFDPMTGIANVQVRAFSAVDAQLIANTMVTLSEELINRINERMHSDAAKFAKREVERGEARLKDIRARLTEFRNMTGVIDPTASLVASNSQLAQTLRANIAQLQTQLNAVTSQKLVSNSPFVMMLQSQIKAAQDQLGSVERAVATNPQGMALSSSVAQFEQLELERQFAQNMLTGAQQAYDQARTAAAAQYLYVEPYVRPSLPESPTYPKQLLSIALVALAAFVLWTILTLAMRSIREHYA